MSYSPNIPQAKDDMSNSQGDLLTNFGQLNTQFGINHVAFDGGANAGKHNFCTFVEQASDPASEEGEHLLYSKDDSGDTELFARPQSNGDAFQVTKDGALFTGLLPIVAVNFDSTGAIQGSSLNVSAINFTAPNLYEVVFSNAQADNNYMWSCSAFYAGSTGVLAQADNDATYGNSVKADRIKLEFVTEAGAAITITRASLICWRVQ